MISTAGLLPLFFVAVCTCISENSDFLSGFAVRVVEDEFIVTYQSRYRSSFRHDWLSSILRLLYLNHTIKNRGYFSRVPSDFDVVRVYNLTVGDVARFMERLKVHNHIIKHVSQQKRLTRKLLAFPESDGQSGSDRNPKVFGKRWRSPSSGTVPLHKSKQPWKLLEAEKIWSMNLCGAGVRVGIFDTGLAPTTNHPHFQRANIRERTDWTRSDEQDSLLQPPALLTASNGIDAESEGSDEAVDGHGHGTFVAGVIAATDASSSSMLNFILSEQFQGNPPPSGCPPPGLAPQADLYIFRVFTDSQVSYTSWFLDAFNYAISRKLHVINLSVGGPDFLDQPFVDKVWELSSNGILLVSAIGNDGPLFGTLNNPADQMDALGVGGVDATGRVARFSSRGMTTWALPFGYGQVKPDVVTFSTGVISSTIDGKCRTLSGTSVASPVVTGVVILLINAALQQNAATQNEMTDTTASPNPVPINPASVKQALISGATRLSQVRVFGTKQSRWHDTDQDTSGMFEQGAGLVDLSKSLLIMQRIKPQASLFPSYLDLTECPYMWPYCSQPMYLTMQPTIANITILNSMGVVGWIRQPPVYHPFTNRNGHRLRVAISYSNRLWPWVGYLAVHLEVDSNPNDTVPSSRFSGIAEGQISLTVESIDETSGSTLYTHLRLPIRANIIPMPDRSRRILFDQFHSLRYPSGYIPRDDVIRKKQPLDWLGDHMHTNLRDLYMHLRKANYYVETLTMPFTCFDATNYGTLLLVDPEEEFFPTEIEKLFTDVTKKGLSLIVFAEWYNTSLIEALRFYDTNTKRLWVPETGGSNLPALNDLLRPFGVEFGDVVYAGQYTVGRRLVHYTSGTSLRRFPHQNLSQIAGHGSVLRPQLVDLGEQILTWSKDAESASQPASGTRSHNVPPVDQADIKWRLNVSPTDPSASVLGMWTPLSDSPHTGRLVTYGDADCLTSTHLAQNCFWLLDAALQFANSRLGRIPSPLSDHVQPASDDLLDFLAKRPFRPKESSLYRISNVLHRDRRYDEVNGSLPRDAYRELAGCPLLATSAVVPLSGTQDNESVPFEPQPLLLHSPLPSSLPSKPHRMDQGCHAGAFLRANIPIAHSLSLARFSLPTDLIYVWRDSLFFYALVLLIFCLMYRRFVPVANRSWFHECCRFIRNPCPHLIRRMRRRWQRWRGQPTGHQLLTTLGLPMHSPSSTGSTRQLTS